MSWVDHIEGTLPADDLRRAFVMGAQWWELQVTGATMFQSDRNLAEVKAEEYFPGGKVPIGQSAQHRVQPTGGTGCLQCGDPEAMHPSPDCDAYVPTSW